MRSSVLLQITKSIQKKEKKRGESIKNEPEEQIVTVTKGRKKKRKGKRKIKLDKFVSVLARPRRTA